MYSIDQFHNHMRLIRHARDLSQRDISRQLRLNINTVARWEHRNIFPRCNTLVETVNICRVSFASMFIEPRFTRDQYSMAAFRSNFRRYRIWRNMRQREAAQLIGSTATQISLYENGRVDPNILTVVRIGNEMDIDLDWLFRHEETEHGPLKPEDPNRQPAVVRPTDRRLLETERTLHHVA